MSKLNVLVAVKRCVDYASKIRVLPDHSVRLRARARQAGAQGRGADAPPFF
jgi:hypothetical protein